MQRSLIILGIVLIGHFCLFLFLKGLIVGTPYSQGDDIASFEKVLYLPTHQKVPEQTALEKADPPPDYTLKIPISAIESVPLAITTDRVTPRIVPPRINIVLPDLEKSTVSHLPDLQTKSALISTGNSNQGPDGDIRSANLLGLEISRDGEITTFLDTSESLKEQHDNAETEIKRVLPNATIVEINGVVFATRPTLEHLKGSPDISAVFVSYYLSLVDRSIIPRVSDQIRNNEMPDHSALYYFSDFEDYADSNDIKQFSQLLQDHSIRFYAFSVGKEPAEAIKKLCIETGGRWMVKKADSTQGPSEPTP